jgi:hypothetical protein
MPVQVAGTRIFHTIRFYLFFIIPVSESSSWQKQSRADSEASSAAESTNKDFIYQRVYMSRQSKLHSPRISRAAKMNARLRM